MVILLEVKGQEQAEERHVDGGGGDGRALVSSAVAEVKRVGDHKHAGEKLQNANDEYEAEGRVGAGGRGTWKIWAEVRYFPHQILNFMKVRR